MDLLPCPTSSSQLLFFFRVRIRVFDGLLTPIRPTVLCHPAVYSAQQRMAIVCVCVASSTSIIRLVVCLELRKNLLPQQQQQPKKKTYWIFFPFFLFSFGFAINSGDKRTKCCSWRRPSDKEVNNSGRLAPNQTPPASFASRPSSPTDWDTPATTATSVAAPAAEAKSLSDPQRYPNIYLSACLLARLFTSSLSLSLWAFYIFLHPYLLYLIVGWLMAASPVHPLSLLLHLSPALGCVGDKCYADSTCHFHHISTYWCVPLE